MTSLAISFPRFVKIVSNSNVLREKPRGSELILVLEGVYRYALRVSAVRPYLGSVGLYYGLVKHYCCEISTSRELLEALLDQQGYRTFFTTSDYEYLEMAIRDKLIGIDLEYAASLICCRTTSYVPAS